MLNKKNKPLEDINKMLEIYEEGKFQGYISKKRIEKDIYNMKNKEIDNYYKLNQNNISNNLSYSLIKTKKENEFISIDMSGKGTVKVGKLEYMMPNFKSVKKEISTSTNKLLIYAILRMIGIESNFTLKEYMDFRELTDEKHTKETIKKDLLILQSILNIQYTSKDNNIQLTTCIITDTNYHYGKIRIIFNKKFANQLKENYMYIHENLIKIHERFYPHIWPLGYFIFEYSRINKICEFNLSIETCLKRLALPSFNHISKVNRNYTERIINPFENTIDGLQLYIKDLKIEYLHDNNTIKDFFENKIKVRIENEDIKRYYRQIKINEEKRNIKKNKTNKNKRKFDTLKLVQEKKSIKEISEILNLTHRTIKNYIKELKSENKL
ncbi:MAG: hypothetical protein ACFFDF_03940 [Candidatus Odinarchaeota archaeon]